MVIEQLLQAEVPADADAAGGHVTDVGIDDNALHDVGFGLHDVQHFAHLFGQIGHNGVHRFFGGHGHQGLHFQIEILIILGGGQEIGAAFQHAGQAALIHPVLPQGLAAQAPVQIVPQLRGMAPGDAHGHFVGFHGGAHQGRLGGVYVRLQANFAPEFHQQFAEGDEVVGFFVVPDLPAEGQAGGGFPVAVAVDVLHAQFVQQGVGGFQVVIAGVIGVDFAESLIHGFYDFLRVHRVHQRLTEAHVVYHFLPCLGGVVGLHGAVGVQAVVGVDVENGGVGVGGGHVGGDAGLLFVFTIEGDVVDGGGFAAEVSLAAHVLHLHHFHVLHQGGGEVIHVRQLIAVRVHLEVIGVALPGGHAVLAGDHHPGIQVGEIGLDQALEIFAGQRVHGVGAFPVGHVHLIEDVGPGVVLRHIVIAHDGAEGLQEFIIGLQRAVAFLGVALMELLQVMGGLEQVGIALPSGDGKMHREAAVGLFEDELEGGIVNDFEGEGIPGGGAAVAHVGRHHGGELLIQHEILDAEAIVFHGDFFTVGPLQALANRKGKLGLIVVHLIILHHVGGHVAGVGGSHGQQGFVVAHEHVRVPVHGLGDQPHGAAVIAAFIVQIFIQNFVGNPGIFGQALFHRGQLAGFHPLGQHGRFVVGAFRGAGKGAHAQQHREGQYQGQFLHEDSLLFLPLKRRGGFDFHIISNYVLFCNLF